MIQVDIAVIGGGLGGVAAALAACRNGQKVLLTEESVWLGGQVSTQAVPPDEHDYIEDYGRTESYAQYRKHIRDYYRRYYPLSEKAQNDAFLNPGKGWVSALCHEPRVSARVLEDMLTPYLANGQLTLWYETEPISAYRNQKKEVEYVWVYRKDVQEKVRVEAHYFLDATELGDLLPMTDTAYVTGSESKDDTGELHAIDVADPLDMQAITWCFAVSLEDEGDYTIEKPALYDFWKEHRSHFWPGSQLSWTYVEPHTLNPIDGSMKKEPGKVDLFGYRKMLDRSNFKEGFLSGDITLVNWPQNDYWLGPVFEIDQKAAERHLYYAKELSRSLLYWLQTEADGTGYPNLKPRGDVMGTEDGFAMRPYIREARRIVPEFRVVEGHIGVDMRQDDDRAEFFSDSVGLGHYHLDLHPSTGQRTYVDMESYPFQIPMGAMIPVETKNLIPASKNIGTTHITNGTYRLHPVEWNIGESAALMAIYSMRNKMDLKTIRKKDMKAFQAFLLEEGVQIEWPKEILDSWEPIT